MRKIGQVLIAIVLWGAFGSLIYFVNPDILQPVWYAPFWTIIWCASTWSVAILLGQMRKGILYGTAITSFFILRFFTIGNILTGLLLFSLVVVVDRYCTIPKRKPLF